MKKQFEKAKNLFVELSVEKKNSLLYLFASIITNGVTFVTVLLIASFVSITFFGAISLVLAIVLVVNSLCILGLDTAIGKYYYEYENGDIQKLVNSVFIIWLIWGLFIVLLSTVIVFFSRGIFFNSNTFSNVDTINLIIAGFLLSFSSIFQQVFIPEQKPFIYSIVSFISKNCTYFAILIFVLFGIHSISSIAVGCILASMISLVVTFSFLRVKPFFSGNVLLIKEIFLFSYPLSINTISSFGFTNGYRLILSIFLSLKELSLYTMANQISAGFYMVASAYATGIIPKIFNDLNKESDKKKIFAYYKKFLIRNGFVFFFIVIIFSYPLLSFFKGGEYFGAFAILPILLIGQLIFFVYSSNYILLIYSKKTLQITISMVLAAMISLSFTKLLVPIWGLWGAGFSIIIAYSILYSISYYFARKLFK